MAANFGGFTQDTQVGGMFGDRTFESNPQDGNDFDASVNGTVPLDWVIWDNVTPSAGNIAISLSTSTNLFINAVRVSTVPEPSTGTLLMLGLIVLGRYVLVCPPRCPAGELTGYEASDLVPSTLRVTEPPTVV